MTIILKGWRYTVFIGAIVGSIGLALYPIVISPMLNPEKYQRIQAETRAGMDRQAIQPGNMKIWSDPFERKSEK